MRLGSNSERCDVDNTAKTSGHGLPLYFAVSSFHQIARIVFNNLLIDNPGLLDEMWHLLDLYAVIEMTEDVD